MTSVSTNPPSLAQAMSRKRRNVAAPLLLGTALIATLATAALGFIEQSRTESVLVLTRDVPYGQPISAEDLRQIDVPYHRASELRGIADPAAVVGQYAARNLGSADLLQPTMLMSAPPTQPVYPNGEALSPNMVPIPFSTLTVGPLSFRDRLNIGFSDPSGDPATCDAARDAAAAQPTLLPSTPSALARPYACRLISDVRVLYVDEAQSIAYLELTPYQAHTIWALQAAGVQLWGERYGISSEQLPSLVRLDIGQVTQAELSTPAAVPSQPIPGADSPLPGMQP